MLPLMRNNISSIAHSPPTLSWETKTDLKHSTTAALIFKVHLSGHNEGFKIPDSKGSDNQIYGVMFYKKKITVDSEGALVNSEKSEPMEKQLRT